MKRSPYFLLPLLAIAMLTGCSAGDRESQTMSMPPGLESGERYIVRWNHGDNSSVETDAVVLQAAGKWIQLKFDEPWCTSAPQIMWLNSDRLQWIGRAEQLSSQAQNGSIDVSAG